MIGARFASPVGRGSAITNQTRAFLLPVSRAGLRGVLSADLEGSGLQGASAAVRFTKIAPSSLSDLKTAVLDDTEDLCAGLRTVASGLPVPGHDTIDLLAADPRGRLVMILVRMNMDEAGVDSALAQWSWVAANLGALRALAPVPGLDPLVDPRVILVASRVAAGARRLAGSMVRPEIELFEATLIAMEDRRGVLVERADLIAPQAAGLAAGIDPVLAHLPAGASRSLVRRVIEELRDATIGGAALRPVAVPGSVELMLGDRVLASLASAPEGLQLRLLEQVRTLAIADDAGCRAAVVEALSLARATEPAASPAMTGALSPEEIAEFERIAGPVEGRSSRHRERDGRDVRREAPAVTVMRHRFVEN